MSRCLGEDRYVSWLSHCVHAGWLEHMCVMIVHTSRVPLYLVWKIHRTIKKCKSLLGNWQPSRELGHICVFQECLQMLRISLDV